MACSGAERRQDRVPYGIGKFFKGALAMRNDPVGSFLKISFGERFDARFDMRQLMSGNARADREINRKGCLIVDVAFHLRIHPLSFVDLWAEVSPPDNWYATLYNL
jgi:hypothetical protein